MQTVVVDLNLCPFARRELDAGRVRFAVSDAREPEALLAALADELERLDDDDGIETTLLIHPHVLGDFLDYNDFLDDAEHLVEVTGRAGVYQIASFHPRYQFAGTDPEDAENWTNRAPWPVLHLLREASLERAIAAHPDTARIPEDNVALMNRMGSGELQRLLLACATAGDD